VSRLSNHLPRGPYLNLLAKGLVCGKINYAIAATAPICVDEDENFSAAAKSIQIALNDVARSLTGSKRGDHLNINLLLAKAKLPSYNSMAIRAIAVETWKAFHSNDGPGGAQNPLGKILFEKPKCIHTTRAQTDGKAPPPLPLTTQTMVCNAIKLWNDSKALREANTLGKAKAAAMSISSKSQL